MPESSDTRDVLLNQLADEFVARHRAGERPGVEEYCARHPGLAASIRELFPALVELERAKADAGPDLAVEAAAPPPVTQLGDSRLLREVGRGGMGVVYEAEQVSLGRRVAIKLLPATVFRDPVKRRRFEREAKAAAKLHHTNIVPVHGFGEHDGTPYYVMQFIPGLGLDAVIDELGRLPADGRTPIPADPPGGGSAALSVVLARSLLGAEDAGTAAWDGAADPATVGWTGAAVEARTATGGGGRTPDSAPPARPDRGSSGAHSASDLHLPGRSGSGASVSTGRRTTYWESVARIGLQVGGALAYAHRQGVLHRDIKPANLLLDLDGVVWVADFGLAKADDSDDLTHTGDLLGTLRYMPPEAFEGRSDARSDVYALGLTLFELVALRPAYEERDRNRLVKQVTTGDPPRLRTARRDAPRDLVTVVEKACERDPGRRYQTAGGLADDLQRFLDGRPITARRATELERLWMWARRNPAVAGAAATVLLVTLLGLAGVWWKYLDAERQKGIALREADKATRAREFLASIFQKAEANERGGNVTVRQLLDEAETRIPVEFADQPGLQLDLVRVIGRAKRGIARRVPQAMILEVHGAVRLQSADGAEKAAVPQALVHLDDRLTLGADARLRLVFLSDLHQEWLQAGQEATVDAGGCEPADAVRERGASPVMTFVRLPKGTFYMGWGGTPSAEEEVLRATASLAPHGQPLAAAGLVAQLGTASAWGRKTEIREDFELAVHAVTQGQWQAVMGENPSYFSRKGTSRYSVQDISDEELKLFPVEMVSWDDTQEFLRRLNERERGRGYLYRLPTEAEWEYACRGGAGSLADCSYHFYFGRPTNDLSSEQANFNGNYPFGDAGKGPYLLRPTRVGAYPPNRLGLCDMHGNVRQWTSSQEGAARVYRGGDWFRSGTNCRAGLRTGDVPTTRYSHIGFRLARVPVR